MISPTIGRVVLVHFGPEMRSAGMQPAPALVCYVHGDRCINAGGFDHSGAPFKFLSLPLLQDNDMPPLIGPFAEWMPYQKGQAAKTEALEAHQRQPAALSVDRETARGYLQSQVDSGRIDPDTGSVKSMAKMPSSGASAQLPESDPRIAAWNAFKASPEWAQHKAWAADASVPGAQEGALWAIFLAGFSAA